MISIFPARSIEINSLNNFVRMEGDVGPLSNSFWIMGNDTRELGEFKMDKDDSQKAFLALKANRDGHDFISGAIESGVRIFIVNQENHKMLSSNKIISGKKDILWIYTKDTLKFLGDMAARYREMIQSPVIGVTGTNGKTSFKEILNSILGEEAYCSQKNFNNEIGMPFSLLSVPLFEEGNEQVRKSNQMKGIILEMGMNHPGEIRYLSGIAKPDIGCITSIGPGHLEFLESVEGVAHAKKEIMEGMKKHSTLFAHGDSPGFEIIKGFALEKKINLKTFGLGEDNDFFPRDIEIEEDSSSFSFLGERFQIPLMGDHQVSNAVGAIAVAQSLGVNLQAVKERLVNVNLPGGRLKLVSKNSNKFFIDFYNANPASMLAGMKAVSLYRKKNDKNSRIIWILGDMRELGSNSSLFHKEIGVQSAGFSLPGDQLIALGDNASDYSQGWLESGGSPENLHIYNLNQKDNLKKDLMYFIHAGDLVFIKGSRSLKMETLLDF